MKTLLYISLSLSLLFNIGCTSNESEQVDKTANYTKDTVLPWVKKVEVRAKPIMKSSVLATIKKNEPLTLTGEQTGFRDTFTLEGKTIIDSWVKVKTEKQRIGWVFRGALKRPGE